MERTYAQSFSISGREFSEAGKVATSIKGILQRLGIDSSLVRRVAIASYEAEMNVVMYAESAEVTLEVNPQRVKVIVEDVGPGIPDVDLAMQEGYSTATSEMRELGFGAGMGLPNMRRNSDDFSITSKVGIGTRVEFTVMINSSS